MANFNKNVVFAVLMCLQLLLGATEAQNNQDCCLSYTKIRLPRGTVTGFTEQLSSEVCDINAIIFHTRKGLHVCANPKQHWVKKQLYWLGEKLKKLSHLK